jgi:purine-binding chemotaxis protein CheW
LTIGLSLKKTSSASVEAEIASANAANKVLQYLTFTLGFERFGVPILSIVEIIEYEAPVPVPGLPNLFVGVIDLRDTAVPVIELAACLNRASESISKRTCILIVETSSRAKHRRVGFVVDSVSEVVDIANNLIEPPPVFGAMSAESYLIGTGRTESGFVVLLDFDPLISMYAGELVDEVHAD